nr:MAG TPA: Uso1 / p115 like vesicle tethering protein [Caudoviricetes sp.]
MEFIIGKNGTKLKASKDEKEFLRKITREVKEPMAKKVVKDNLSGVKLKKTMTKEEVEKIIQIIGENYSAVCLSMAECILKTLTEATDKIHNAVKTSTNFITLINDELGIELSEDDEDEDTDDDDEEDEDEDERSED